MYKHDYGIGAADDAADPLVLRALFAEPTKEMYGLQNLHPGRACPAAPFVPSWPAWSSWV